MVRKDLRVFFISVAILILFFLTVRMIKYDLTESIDTLNRYMWYSYYVPQMIIPPTLLLATLSIENEKVTNVQYELKYGDNGTVHTNIDIIYETDSFELPNI